MWTVQISFQPFLSPAGSNGWDKDAALAPRRRPSPPARNVLSGGHAIFGNLLVHELVLRKLNGSRRRGLADAAPHQVYNVVGQERLIKHREVSLFPDGLQLVGKPAAGH
jgi:hypothetical protein